MAILVPCLQWEGLYAANQRVGSPGAHLGEATPEHGMSISLRGYRDCTRHHTVLRFPPCLVCRAAAGLPARSPRREGWCMLCRDPSEKSTLT